MSNIPAHILAQWTVVEEPKLVNSREIFLAHQHRLEQEHIERKRRLFHELNALLQGWGTLGEITVHDQFAIFEKELNAAGFYVEPHTGSYIKLGFNCQYRCPGGCKCTFSSHHSCDCGAGCGPTKQ